jgi:hypothetical protein
LDPLFKLPLDMCRIVDKKNDDEENGIMGSPRRKALYL